MFHSLSDLLIRSGRGKPQKILKLINLKYTQRLFNADKLYKLKYCERRFTGKRLYLFSKPLIFACINNDEVNQLTGSILIRL